MAAARKASATTHALSRRPISIPTLSNPRFVVGRHLNAINLYGG